MSRTLFALAVLASCGPASVPAPAIGNHPVMTYRPDYVGGYACWIVGYAAFPCVIRRERDGDTLVLEKLAGSQRFKGTVIPSPHGQGFAFTGTFFCPDGECTHPLSGTFRPGPGGELHGVFFEDADLIVTLAPATPGEFGGAGYGDSF